MADVFSIIDVLPLDALYLSVGSIARGSDGVTQSNHAQHPTAARDNGAVLVGCAGMKNLAGGRTRWCQSGGCQSRGCQS